MVVELGKRLEVLELVMWEPVRKLVEDFLNEECVSYSIAPEDGALTGREVQRRNMNGMRRNVGATK